MAGFGYADLWDLSDLVAIVTGGGGDLGREIAKGLAEFGARLVIADVDLGRGEAAARELVKAGAAARAVHVDVTDTASTQALAADVVAHDGRIDILVNAAGVFTVAPAVEFSPEAWKRVIEVNLTGVFLVSQAVGAVMLRQGRGKVINLASVSSQVGNPGYAAYAASKGGVALLTKVLGAEWCRHGVNVNAIGPAFTETSMTRPYLEREGWREHVLGKIPMGRLGAPGDVVGAAVFLASRASDFVVGQTIYVDGGRTLG